MKNLRSLRDVRRIISDELDALGEYCGSWKHQHSAGSTGNTGAQLNGTSTAICRRLDELTWEMYIIVAILNFHEKIYFS